MSFFEFSQSLLFRDYAAYYAVGKGVFMTKDDGSEMVTWTRHQLEQRRRDVGSIFCSTSSTTGNKLAFLNNIVGVFEYDADKMGNSENMGVEIEH